MANVSKICGNLNDSTFRRFKNHCECSCIEKMSLLVVHKILRLFVNTWTTDDKHYLLNRDNLAERILKNYLKNKKLFLNFFLHFQNLLSILNIYLKRTTLIADVFPEFRLRKIWLDKCLKSRVSEDD